MKKILSIMVALGMLMGLFAMAVPAGAADPCATISADNDCSGKTATYTINVAKSPATLLPGNDKLSVTFPTGTSLAAVTKTDVTVGASAHPDSVTISGSHIEFPTPIEILVNTPFTITIADVVNGPAGTNEICLDYQLVCCDPEVFCCVNYTIVPAIAELGFHFDFDDTYAGIAEDFIPPFKACGQACYGPHVGGVGWVTLFDLILREDVPGCEPPCNNASMWFSLTKCPAGETVTFKFDALPYYTLTAANVSENITLPNVLMPASPVSESWQCWIHFSSPGEYELCFYLECPAVPCAAGKQMVAEKCMPCKAYQWKEAEDIPLYRKWNLISLPLVPLVDPPIDDVLDAYPLKSQILSVWNFDQCKDKWYVYPTPGPGEEALTELVDGKSYWVRIVYNSTHAAGTPAGVLWTWGTPEPTPPASPSAYEVCEGWNMVGLTGGGILDHKYLWNWWEFGYPEYSGIYGWDPGYGIGPLGAQQWWSVLPFNKWLPQYYTGEGYWIAFEHDGMIYPP